MSKYSIVEIKEQVRITVGIACGLIAAGADYKKIAESCTEDLMKFLEPIVKDANEKDDWEWAVNNHIKIELSRTNHQYYAKTFDFPSEHGGTPVEAIRKIRSKIEIVLQSTN
jgi:hypothetical protein